MERDRNESWPFVSDLEVRAFQYQLFPAKSCGILAPCLFTSVAATCAAWLDLVMESDAARIKRAHGI